MLPNIIIVVFITFIHLNFYYYIDQKRDKAVEGLIIKLDYVENKTPIKPYIILKPLRIRRFSPKRFIIVY